jgi:hypothetical protein
LLLAAEETYSQVALAYAMYDIVHGYMKSIVNTHWGAGKLILVGGIMINAPEGMLDLFVPMHVDVLQAGAAPIVVPLP